MIQFLGSIHRIAVDREGETTLTLKIPQSDLAQAVFLLQLTEKVLAVSVEVKE